MKKVFSVLLSLSMIGMLFLSGCTYAVGNKQVANDDAVTQIKIGKSTKSDVTKLMGEPSKVSFTDKEEIWDYNYTKSQVRATSFIPYVGVFAGGTDTEMHTLTLTFNDRGVVSKIGKGKSTGGGGGLQDMAR